MKYDKHITVRITESAYDKVRRDCKKESIKVSKKIRNILEDHYGGDENGVLQDDRDKASKK